MNLVIHVFDLITIGLNIGSPDVIPKFLAMIRRDGAALRATLNPKAFVFPIFEIEEGFKPPAEKWMLMRYFKSGIAVQGGDSINSAV